MNRNRLRLAGYTIVVLAALVHSEASTAQELERGTVTASGETSAGGRFELVSLAGQPVVGRAEGEAYVLRVGALVLRPGAAGSLLFTDGFENAGDNRRRDRAEGESP